MGERIPDGVADLAARESMIAVWEKLCADPQLAGLPFKVETTGEGKIIMSPANLRHASLQGEIVGLLHSLVRESGVGGCVMSECPVVTADGVKVPDVAWLSRTQADAFAGKAAAPAAPEVCIEIKSPSNPKKEMDLKRALYFAAGAKEVWVCDEQGVLTFWNLGGRVKRSKVFPLFPGLVSFS